MTTKPDPKSEQAIAEYLKAHGQLSGEELARLAQQMVETDDPDEVKRLKEQIVAGFYGDEEHA